MKITRRKNKQNDELMHNVIHQYEGLSSSYLSAFIKNLLHIRGGVLPDELLLNEIYPPKLLHGLDSASELLANALIEQKTITIVGDFDADGATSTALAYLALKAFGAKSVNFLIPSRFKNGYGLSPILVDEAFNLGSDIILTVDNGISAFDGIDRANQLGIQVIVTDHHLPGEAIPDAHSIINPNLVQSKFPSKHLAGVGVTFYLMMALRAFLRSKDYFNQYGIDEPNLAAYLDLVALGTVADVVPLDNNNRILVSHGLKRIRAGVCRPGISALLQIAQKDMARLDAKDLGFVLGPRLNAAGRLDDMSLGVELLICDEPHQAIILAQELDSLNESRKEIEQEMQSEALTQCDVFIDKTTDIPIGITLYHQEWHQGIVGLIASRIKEKFHRPVFAFALGDEAGLLKGSGRSISGIHLRDVLEHMQTLHPGLMEKFGGHAMAAGLTLKEAHLQLFSELFEKTLKGSSDLNVFNGEILTDGELPGVFLNIQVAKAIKEAGPWGQGFAEPKFNGRFKIIQQRLLKDKHLKLVLEPVYDNNHSIKALPILDAIAFNIDRNIWPDATITHIQVVYQLDVNYYRGQENLQLMVEYMEPI